MKPLLSPARPCRVAPYVHGFLASMGLIAVCFFAAHVVVESLSSMSPAGRGVTTWSLFVVIYGVSLLLVYLCTIRKGPFRRAFTLGTTVFLVCGLVL